MAQAQRLMHLRLHTPNLHQAETKRELVPDGVSSGGDALTPTHSESTLARNGMGAGENKITQTEYTWHDINIAVQ